jgi:beta-galactosidase
MRRLVTLLAVMATTLGAATPAAASDPRSAVVGGATPLATSAELRQSLPLQQGWRFALDDALSDQQALDAQTFSWQAVNLPHTWNRLDAATTVQTTPASKPYRRGVGWYRLRFDAPVARAGTQWLEFGGASIAATVWLNGVRLGEHRGAFTAFRFDVTLALRARGNELLVKTDNRAPTRYGEPTTIVPLSGDFNMAGGLYRGVRLISTADKAHVALDDFGGPGVYASTTALRDGTASVQVLTRLRQHGSSAARYTLRTRLLSAVDRPVAAPSLSPVRLAPGAALDVRQDLQVAKARLWQGAADPYLHRLVVELVAPGGRVIDRVQQAFGIRTVAADPQRGFVLNGQPLNLRGVNLHQDYQAKAWAIEPAQTDESLAIVREMGANAMRLAHYPHAPHTYERADALGLVVMAELPFVNSTAIAFYGPKQCEQALADPEANGIADNARLQLREMLRQLHNHASIAFWSLANEVTTFPCGQTTERNNVAPLLRSLQAIAKAEDPLRVTTVADQVTRRGDTLLPDPISIVGLTDSYGVNRYFQWYYGNSATQLGEHLDALHQQHPALPIGLTEYGAGSALSQHTDNPLGGRPCQRDVTGARRVCPQPEGYAAHVHEKALAAITARPWLYGSFVWNSFDFGSGIRHEGDIGATNTKGLVSFDRRVRKDSFYLYQANWSQQPVTHIAGRRHAERAYPLVDVVVYSNASSTTLMLDDQVLQTLDAAQCPLRVCTFRNLRLRPGTSMLTALGRHGEGWLSDAVHWRLAPDNAENIYIAAGQLLSGVQSDDALLGRHRYGSDNFFDGGEPSVNTHNGPVKGINERDVPAEPRVWDQYRAGKTFGYRIPLPAGRYRVTLGFLSTEAAKSATASAGAYFNVDANGRTVITALDLAAAAAEPGTAITRSFDLDVGEQPLHLVFSASSGLAQVSNLAIVRQP